MACIGILRICFDRSPICSWGWTAQAVIIELIVRFNQGCILFHGSHMSLSCLPLSRRRLGERPEE